MSTRSRHRKHRQHTYLLQILTLLENITTPTIALYSLSNFKILHLNLSDNYCQKVMFSLLRPIYSDPSMGKSMVQKKGA